MSRGGLPNCTDKKALGVDLDNVIAETDRKIRETVGNLYGLHLRQRDIKEFEYHRCGITKEQERRVFEVFNSGGCSDLVVVPGARAAIEKLRRLYKVLVVTSRDPATHALTREWLARKKISFDELVFAAKEQAVYPTLDYAVEDRWEYALQLAEQGVSVLLYSYPWNRDKGDHPRIRVVRNWREIVQQLLEASRARHDHG